MYNVGISEKDVALIPTNYVGLRVFINNSWNKNRSLFMFIYLENKSNLTLNCANESNLFMFTHMHTHNTKWTIKQDFKLDNVFENKLMSMRLDWSIYNVIHLYVYMYKNIFISSITKIILSN